MSLFLLLLQCNLSRLPPFLVIDLYENIAGQLLLAAKGIFLVRCSRELLPAEASKSYSSTLARKWRLALLALVDDCRSTTISTGRRLMFSKMLSE